MTLAPLSAVDLHVSALTMPEPSAAPPRGSVPNDYMMFLRMLTVQMQNQDPLNPMSASDFAVQLATFAGVEQATRTNELLSSLLARAGLAEAARWVDMEVRVKGEAWFDGSPLALAVDTLPEDVQARLVVRDAAGAIVDSRPLDPTEAAPLWDGVDRDGRALAPGFYRFEIELLRGDEVIDTVDVSTWQPVREVRVQAGAVLLGLPGQRYLELEAIDGVRRPREQA